MSLIISTEVKCDFNFKYKALAEKVVNTVLDHEDFPYEVQVSLTILGSAAIQDINRENRDIDAPTDVLSFPMIEYSEAGFFEDIDDQCEALAEPESGEVMLGDIVLNIDRIKSQAVEYGHTEKREYAFLITHSMLHLLGYDHMTEEEADVMEGKQREILSNMGINR